MINRVILLFLLSTFSPFVVGSDTSSLEQGDCSDSETVKSRRKSPQYFIVFSDDANAITKDQRRTQEVVDTIKKLIALQNSESRTQEDIDNFPYDGPKDWVVNRLESDLKFSAKLSRRKSTRKISAAINRRSSVGINLLLSKGRSEEEKTYFDDPQGAPFLDTFKSPAIIFFVRSSHAVRAISSHQRMESWIERQLPYRGDTCLTDDFDCKKSLKIQMTVATDLEAN